MTKVVRLLLLLLISLNTRTVGETFINRKIFGVLNWFGLDMFKVYQS